MEQLIKESAEIILKSKYLVVFTGAGMSVESGIPPFRGENGLWSKYNPIVLDINYFFSNRLDSWKVIKALFYDFFGKSKPNKGHQVLAKWENSGLLKATITQNIDNLHQEAGSKNVIEFHGTASQIICTNCQRKYPSSKVNLENLPPLCESCEGLLKPDFIFFGEGIPLFAHDQSFIAARKCDVLLVIGTTGEVMPASMIPYTAKENGAKIIEINPETSLFTKQITDIYLKGKAGEILAKLDSLIC
jgi:NAD-dependent deacetylase